MKIKIDLTENIHMERAVSSLGYNSEQAVVVHTLAAEIDSFDLDDLDSVAYAVWA